jgi:two-component system phosphate regulon sensor histidine kinase PhoR
MKRRLRFIFSLLTVCLLGSYGFQAYWLYGSYQLAQGQFISTARAALEAVVQRQQVKRADKIFNIKFNNYAGPNAPPGKAAHWQIEALDTGVTATQAIASRRPKVLVLHPAPSARNAPSEQARAARTDSLARQLSSFVISGWNHWQPVNLTLFARAYRAELRLRQAEQPFRLDTVAARTVLPAARRAGYPLHTPAVQLNPVQRTWLVASFRPPTAYVLRRMAGSLAGSAALLGLTTGCFVLMLSTILRQKKLAEVKNDFINNMTHELKTPLATVSAAVEALQDFGALADPRKTDAYLTIARQELTRLSDLVEKVLHIAVEERHGQVLALHPEPTQPAALVAELVGRHELQATKQVQVDIHIAASDTLLLDRLHLAGALHNLLDNAIKYSGDQVRIRIRGRAADDGWLLTVADDGVGIAPGYQAAVFEQFFRVPTGNLHPVKGFGLGLYYVRQVAEGHGGRVSVRSTPGQGSEFGIWLPQSLISYQQATSHTAST